MGSIFLISSCLYCGFTTVLISWGHNSDANFFSFLHYINKYLGPFVFRSPRLHTRTNPLKED